jgi:hypothetical protein
MFNKYNVEGNLVKKQKKITKTSKTSTKEKLLLFGILFGGAGFLCWVFRVSVFGLAVRVWLFVFIIAGGLYYFIKDKK